MSKQIIPNLADPVSATDAVNLQTAQSLIAAAGGLKIVPAGGLETNASATPLVVFAFSFAPSDYGTITAIVFRAIAATGNASCTVHVKLRDITTGVDITTFNITNQTTEAVSDRTLTVGTPGTNVIASTAKMYEVSIWVDSPTVGTDVIQLYSAQMRVT